MPIGTRLSSPWMTGEPSVSSRSFGTPRTPRNSPSWPFVPNAIAGAVSVRPQAAGSAAGLTGFAQMAAGAAATQAVTLVLAGAATALPMAWMMFAEVLATGAVFWVLVRRS